MKWFILTALICVAWLMLCGFAPLHNKYDSEGNINEEFRAVYNEAQSLNFKVFVGTPSLKDLQDNECVVVSSGSFVRFMFRNNQEIYSVTPSCVTVRR